MKNPILEVVIGLSYVYFVLSIVCSAIQEWIAALLTLRARTLEAGIRHLLNRDEGLVNSLYSHPLVRSLATGTHLDLLLPWRRHPSYISSSTFVTALFDSLDFASLNSANVPTRTKQNTPLEAATMVALSALVKYSGATTLTTGRPAIESWFNEAMERVSAWYKRRSQLLILLFAVVVSVFLNADTLMLAEALWINPELRTAVTAAVTEQVKKREKSSGATDSTVTPSTTRGLKPTGSDHELPDARIREISYQTGAQEPVATKAPENRSTDVRSTVKSIQEQLQTLPIPLGWNCTEDEGGDIEAGGRRPADWQKGRGESPRLLTKQASLCAPHQKHVSASQDSFQFLLKVFGPGATCVAVSLGSPFWFQILQKLVNIRAAGKSPDEPKKG